MCETDLSWLVGHIVCDIGQGKVSIIKKKKLVSIKIEI